MWRHTQGSSGRPASDLGWGSSSKTAPGSLPTGSPARRTPPPWWVERCSPPGAPQNRTVRAGRSPKNTSADDLWKACLSAGGGVKRRYQYCTDTSGTIIYLRALQGHSGRNLIDPPSQDNVIIQSGFFQHVYHFGCAFNLHSIVNNGLIPGGQNSSKRQTVFFLPTDPRHQDPAKIDHNEPRRAQCLEETSRRGILG